MERNEFRIGNIVADEKGNIITIFNILQSYCRGHFNNELEDQLLYYENIKPIKLTEEWLLKFGFFSKYKSIHTHWYCGNFGLDQASDEDDDGNSIPERQEFQYQFVFDIKYVHQLQNLYFALTGNELVLKG